MKGVFVTKMETLHEDERRKLIGIMNGQFEGRNIKLLDVKETQYLGGKSGHWHHFKECMVILKGRCYDYTMENLDVLCPSCKGVGKEFVNDVITDNKCTKCNGTGNETETFDFKEGDIVFRTGRIIHGGTFEKGTLVLDIGEDTYVSSDFNDFPREDTK